MTPATTLEVRVSHRFKASPERVFDAWLDTRMLARWMAGPAVRDEEIVHLELDPRVGGTFSFKVLRDGEEIDHVGEYREIDRPRRLVFTWAIGERSADDEPVTVEIEPLDEGCVLHLVHPIQPEWAEYAPRTERGWTHMLGKLDEALGREGAGG